MISRPNRGPNVGGHLNWPNRKINKTKNEVNINTAAILAALVDSSTDNGPPRMRKLIEGTFGGWFLISVSKKILRFKFSLESVECSMSSVYRSFYHSIYSDNEMKVTMERTIDALK